MLNDCVNSYLGYVAKPFQEQCAELYRRMGYTVVFMSEKVVGYNLLIYKEEDRFGDKQVYRAIIVCRDYSEGIQVDSKEIRELVGVNVVLKTGLIK